MIKSKTPVMFRILLLILCVSAWNSVFAVTPEEALSKAKDKLGRSTSLTADFSMQADGKTFTGNIYSKGSKFAIISNAGSNWYNGKDLYTYSPSKNETTVFSPSASDLAEVNPLLYINSSSEFKVAGTKGKKAGVESVALVPKNTGTGVRTVVLELDSNTFLPKNIKVYPTSGGVIDITVSNLKLNAGVSDSSFEYPKDKYKNVQLIDMR